MALAPGMQQPTDWTAGAVECEDEYALLAEIGLAEALEPRNLGEAKKRPDWPLWEVAIEEELKTLKEVETWEVVKVPAGVNVVGSKWVFGQKRMQLGMWCCYDFLSLFHYNFPFLFELSLA